MGQKSGREIRVGNFVSLSNFRKKRILGGLHFYYDDKRDISIDIGWNSFVAETLNGPTDEKTNVNAIICDDESDAVFL